jgi:hypothetical protein
MLSTAIVWGIAWIPMSIALYGAAALLGADLPRMRFWGEILLGVSIRGAMSGAAFAGALAVVGRRMNFEALGVPRMMLCGALGAVVAPVMTLGVIALGGSLSVNPAAIGLSLLVSSALGAVSGAATLLTARRARDLGEPSESKPISAGAA